MEAGDLQTLAKWSTAVKVCGGQQKLTFDCSDREGQSLSSSEGLMGASQDGVGARFFGCWRDLHVASTACCFRSASATNSIVDI